MRIAAVSAALLATLLAGPALAQTPAQPKAAPAPQATKPKEAPKAPVAKPKEPAKPTMAQLAAEGDFQAQYLLGQTLLAGAKGVSRDPDAAINWLGLAAANGNADAAFLVAKTHEQAKRPLDAARWWYLAGLMGSEPARDRFLDMFLAGQTDGIGGETVLRWLEPRLAAGDVAAILAVAGWFENPEMPLHDLAVAENWYRKAALDGDVEAQYRLGRLLLTRPGGWRLLYKDPEREKNNEERDRLYASLPEAIEAAGDDRRTDLLRPGMLEGEAWLTKAAGQGHAEAQFLLAVTKLTGMNLPFALDQAVMWLEAAAEQGHAGALMVQADLAAKGQGFFGKDPVRAWVSLDQAAQQGRKDAAAARDDLAKTMSGRQLARARQAAQELREIRGM